MKKDSDTNPMKKFNPTGWLIAGIALFVFQILYVLVAVSEVPASLSSIRGYIAGNAFGRTIWVTVIGIILTIIGIVKGKKGSAVSDITYDESSQQMDASAEDTALTSEQDTVSCPRCNKSFAKHLDICPFCGEEFEVTVPDATPIGKPEKQSHTIMTVLAVASSISLVIASILSIMSYSTTGISIQAVIYLLSSLVFCAVTLMGIKAKALYKLISVLLFSMVAFEMLNMILDPINTGNDAITFIAYLNEFALALFLICAGLSLLGVLKNKIVPIAAASACAGMFFILRMISVYYMIDVIIDYGINIYGTQYLLYIMLHLFGYILGYVFWVMFFVKERRIAKQVN